MKFVNSYFILYGGIPLINNGISTLGLYSDIQNAFPSGLNAPRAYGTK